MAEYQNSPVFANRYRFQPVGDDWDRGRSGFTHLIFDTKEERLGVIKRAEIKSQQAVEGLKNEVAALLDLKGLGVPEIYDTGEAEYGSKNYFYMVIEYIDGIRVEKNLDSLSAPERAEILTQFFGLLAKAHPMGIVNGDVDLKHLFWRRDKKQLVVIDWGNSKLNIDSKKNTEFAYDLARSAEIIYSLTTRKGHPPATGTISLPDDALLFPDLAPLPNEFRSLCKWAPRAPVEGAKAPNTARELFEVSKKWAEAAHRKKSYKASPKRAGWVLPVALGIVIVTLLIFFTFFGGFGILQTPSPTTTLTSTEIPISALSETPVVSITPSPSGNPIETSTPLTELTSTLTVTQAPAVSPSPGIFTAPVLLFDDNLKVDEKNPCWVNDTNLPLGLKPVEGFSRRDTDNYWRFGIEKGRTPDEFIRTDFSQCLGGKQVEAIAINIWVPRLELQRDSPDSPGITEPGKELGFFIENANGQEREYTIWIDKNKSMHLRVQENNDTTLDEVVLIVNEENLKIKGTFPRLYAEFPIQIFFEINNNGLDIIYLRQGPVQEAVKAEDIDPSQMIRVDNAVRSTLGNIQKIGLIGYGGETQTAIWPLVFFGK